MPTMKMRAPYEFSTAVRVLTGMSDDATKALVKKIDKSAPKDVVTGDEISRFVAAAGKSSAKLTADERAAAPALDFLKRALAMQPAKTAKVSVEDMSKLKVPQSVPLANIRGDLTLPTREVIRGTSIGDILDSDTPVSKLHAFAKSLSADGKNLTLKELLKAQRDDHRGYDSYLQCNELLERYFIGDDVKGVHKVQYRGKEMEVSSNVERSYDTYNGGRVDVNLRPNMEVKGKPGDIVIIQSSLRHSEPEVALLTADRPSARFPWWGDENKPSTMTVVVARPDADGTPRVVDSVKLEIPVNVAHVKAATMKPHATRVRASDG